MTEASASGSPWMTATGRSAVPRSTSSSPSSTRARKQSSPRRSWYSADMPAAARVSKFVRRERTQEATLRWRSGAPAPELPDDRLQFASPLGQLVNPRSRGRGEVAALYDTSALQLVEAV